MTDDIPRTPPPREPTFPNYVHSSVAWPLVALYTVFMGTLSLACSFFDRRGRLQHWCASTWSRMIARTALLDVRVHGAEHLRAGESYVFLSTHQSWMDIPVMLGYLPSQLRIAAKREVFLIPFLGWHMRRSGQIPINRGSTVESIESLRRAARLLGGGVSAFLFPEGTRTRDGSLQPLKKGGFRLALESGLCIVPVTITGTRRAMPRGSMVLRAGPVEMHIDPPIPTAGLDEADLPALIQKVRDAMTAHFVEVTSDE
ncbi:MAG TPA: lysophospholipid acyltransferase family protein [Pyrinomonadaceae bacterium]|jgi:1-acyl-sn-glycerol-3-phosphate acyltransferase|nr:lysophospholipid acyltransferase family protein [Pyrinomonadaceae bacterium]